MRPSGAFHGSIGGGALEWQALANAQAELKRGRGPVRFLRWSLGPQLGQCCSGRVTLMIETFAARDLAEIGHFAQIAERGALYTKARLAEDGRWRRELSDSPRDPVAIVQLADGTIAERFTEPTSRLLLFGAGHVSKAVVWAMAPLLFQLRWIDPRPDIFPAIIPHNAVKVQARDVLAEIEAAAAGAFVLVMTHYSSTLTLCRRRSRSGVSLCRLDRIVIETGPIHRQNVGAWIDRCPDRRADLSDRDRRDHG